MLHFSVQGKGLSPLVAYDAAGGCVDVRALMQGIGIEQGAQTT
jgi:hypothetical protein